MEIHGKISDLNEGNAEKGIFCQLCEFENIKTPANGICLECEEQMCNTCFRHHLKANLCRHHELVDMDKVSLSQEKSEENVEKCKKHENETVKFYCRAHHIVGCGDCIILGHSTCQPNYIKEVSKGFQENEEFKRLMTKLEQLESTNRETDEKIQTNRKDCKEMHEEALKEIRQFRVDVNNYLDKAESDIITETEQLKQDNDLLLDKLQQDCEKLSSEIEKLKKKFTAQHHRENVLFIHAVHSKPLLQNIEKEVAKMLADNKTKKFKFVPDEQLSSIVKFARKLGTWNMPESMLDVDEICADFESEVIEGSQACQKDYTDWRNFQYPQSSCKHEQYYRSYVGQRVRYIEYGYLEYEYVETGFVTADLGNGGVYVVWDSNGEESEQTIGLDVEII